MMYLIMYMGAIIIGIITAVNGYIIFDFNNNWEFSLDAFLLNLIFATIWNLTVFILYKLRR